jgi:hypothetical protein
MIALKCLGEIDSMVGLQNSESPSYGDLSGPPTPPIEELFHHGQRSQQLLMLAFRSGRIRHCRDFLHVLQNLARSARVQARLEAPKSRQYASDTDSSFQVRTTESVAMRPPW